MVPHSQRKMSEKKIILTTNQQARFLLREEAKTLAGVPTLHDTKY